jgi:minor extracellular serine protease Vpr
MKLKFFISVAAFFSLVCFFPYFLRAQAQFSPQANLLLRKIETRSAKNSAAMGLSASEIKAFNLRQKNGAYFIGGLIWASEFFSENQIKALGGQVRSKAGNIWSVDIPLAALSQLKRLSGLAYFEMDRSYRLLLDKSRLATQVNLVHQGVNLPKRYLGNNTVIGIIDFGFDFLHPTFRDTSGTRYRIKSYWDQGANFGKPPAGYNYGAEYSGEQEIRALRPSNLSHGTHVAGIAAGSGYGSGLAYRGAAPQSDIIVVSPPSVESHSEILDAARYIVDKAKALGKPCVINMSLGGLFDAMDGNSLLEVGLENIVNQSAGVALVAAAGNWGQVKGHLTHTFANDEIATIPAIDQALYGELQTISIWGEEGKDFEVQLELMNIRGQSELVFPSLKVSSAASLNAFALIGADTLYVYMEANPRSVLNGKPSLNIILASSQPIDFNNPLNRNRLRLPKMKIRGKSGTIHAWNSWVGLPFSKVIPFNEQPVAGVVEGDNDYMVGVPATSRGVIAVGAYTTINEYQDYRGQIRKIPALSPVGEIAPFSSRGPSHDKRVKPEITAPGNAVASSVSSRGNIRDTLVVKSDVVNGDIAKYAVFEGTSMAAPMVSGIIALLLEANPNLNFTQIKNILISTAIKDNFTGNISSQGSPIWGWGKIDAYAALRAALRLASVEYTKSGVSRSAFVYPIPLTEKKATLQLENFAGSELEVRLIDLRGKVLLAQRLSSNANYFEHILELEGLNKGMYFLQVSDKQGMHNIKLAIE